MKVEGNFKLRKYVNRQPILEVAGHASLLSSHEKVGRRIIAKTDVITCPAGQNNDTKIRIFIYAVLATRPSFSEWILRTVHRLRASSLPPHCPLAQ